MIHQCKHGTCWPWRVEPMKAGAGAVRINSNLKFWKRQQSEQRPKPPTTLRESPHHLLTRRLPLPTPPDSSPVFFWVSEYFRGFWVPPGPQLMLHNTVGCFFYFFIFYFLILGSLTRSKKMVQEKTWVHYEPPSTQFSNLKFGK